ncbi:hypothetical protein CWI42_010950 [Ordospora colligata]|uniref:Uncharacterized protein n=1 Tax=Ordospora colligata OC4 TaxID=1354746 RepID=A0A0B2UN00_9MICR|nr:uncharacterized protein M896_010950 [Ordospora colligata OC4]KHN70442.1 hypothetical protein M896_010950 [Ordospora colligata OC4]TBU17192.1 hypothetical protein CWI41_010950 [Ordospora colligata]TBU17442.1 hypothetical protein CWI40_010950 [Ordospora colligata]TBU19622.1 hypothetical protein CWI42_010950 [Ordospora colligata]
MKFSVEETERLRRMMRSQSKNEEIAELSKEIEKKEMAMMNSISEDYLNIINKCSSLDVIKTRLSSAMKVNNEFGMEISDGVLQYSGVISEMEENDLLDTRLDMLMEELKRILEFVESALYYEDVNKDEREDAMYYFKLVQNVHLLEKGLCIFRKYVFFANANQILMKVKNGVMSLMIRDVDLWVEWASNNVKQAGEEISEMFMTDQKRGHIFGALGSQRGLFVNRMLLCVLHESRRLGMDPVIIERINERRRKGIDYNLRRDDPRIVMDAAGFVLWSHYLTDLDDGFKTHNRFAFKALQDNEMVQKPENFMKVKDGLVCLRNLAMYLMIDSEDLDRIISNVAIGYFEKQGHISDGEHDAADVKMIGEAINVFIDECYEFVSNVTQYSNELDEMLGKKVDEYLCELIENNLDDIKEFGEAAAVVRRTLEHLEQKNNFYKDREYKCVKQLERNNKRFAKEMLDESIKRVDELFEEILTNRDFGILLLEMFLKTKEAKIPDEMCNKIKYELVIHIKDGFMMMTTNEMSPQDIRMVNGYLCSFYGYLKGAEPELQSILTEAVEMYKNEIK